jgi:predicted transcriptional regulator
MHLNWEISDGELARWRSFIDANITNEFVIDREKRNISRKTVDLSKNMLWYVHVGCQVTTQQRSGPTSAVSRFMDSDSKTLKYNECAKSSNTVELIQSEISKAGLRRSNIIAKNLSQILSKLEAGGWDSFIQQLKTIEKDTSKNKERNVAKYIAKEFAGLGPKQSRNYIQWLGLARYEIPLDSRITKTMKKLGCSFVPKATALNDETVYLLIQEGVQQIAGQLGIYPCILDACIFSSFDVNKA